MKENLREIYSFDTDAFLASAWLVWAGSLAPCPQGAQGIQVHGALYVRWWTARRRFATCLEDALRVLQRRDMAKPGLWELGPDARYVLCWSYLDWRP